MYLDKNDSFYGLSSKGFWYPFLCKQGFPFPSTPCYTSRCSHTSLFFKIYLFLEQGEGSEKNIAMWEKHQSASLTCPQLRVWPTIQPCVLTGNQTSGLSFFRMMPNPFSHTCWGHAPPSWTWGSLMIGNLRRQFLKKKKTFLVSLFSRTKIRKSMRQIFPLIASWK